MNSPLQSSCSCSDWLIKMASTAEKQDVPRCQKVCFLFFSVCSVYFATNFDDFCMSLIELYLCNKPKCSLWFLRLSSYKG